MENAKRNIYIYAHGILIPFSTDNFNNCILSMDGPKIPWTVSDLFASPPRLAMVYHVIVTSYNVFNPMGSIMAGGLLLTAGRSFVSSRHQQAVAIPSASKSQLLLRSMANGGLIGGILGITLGLGALYSKSRQGESLQPLPWNEEGIQTRVSGIQQNYKIRTLDLYVWVGAVFGALSHSVWNAMNQPKLGLSLLQTISLGSTVGSLSAITSIAYTEYQIRKALEALQDDE
jgi:hypothetical protein